MVGIVEVAAGMAAPCLGLSWADQPELVVVANSVELAGSHRAVAADNLELAPDRVEPVLPLAAAGSSAADRMMAVGLVVDTAAGPAAGIAVVVERHMLLAAVAELQALPA